MIEILGPLASFAAGAILGAIFFGGLWWTTRRAIASSRPAPWLFGSMAARTGVVLAGFYFFSLGDWDRLLLCLLGFVGARVATLRLARPREVRTVAGDKGAAHAP